MKVLGAILAAELRAARHRLASVRRESRLKVAFVSVSAVLLWLGIFQLSRLGFGLFEDFGAGLLAGRGPGGLGLADLVMARLLAVFALALLAMLVVSNALVAYATLYRSREVSLLLLSPVPIATLFLGRFVQCVTFSSWASAYLGSPALLAFGVATGAPAAYYFSLAAFYPPFVLIPAAAGAILAMAAALILPRLGRRVWLLLTPLPLAALWLFARGSLRLPDLAEDATFQALFELFSRSQAPYLPSHWLAQGVMGAARGDLREALFFLLLLASNALFFTWLATLAAERWLYPGLSRLASSSGRRPLRRGAGLGLERLLAPLPQPARTLMVKDLRLFARDPAQWSQFLVFFGIMAIYLANLREVASAQDFWRALRTLLNLGALLLILASLTTRFVFPLISLEGRRFWILGLAPLPRRQVVWQKLLLSVAVTALFTVALAFLSAWRLGLSPLELTLSVAATAAATVALSGLAVGLGSLYADFEQDNPTRIVSGLGGTLCFLLSLVYVAAIGAAQAAVLLWEPLAAARLGPRPTWLVPAALAWIAGASLLATWLPLALGLRQIENAEF